MVTPQPAPDGFDWDPINVGKSTDMDPQAATYQPLVISPSRRFGWWIEGRKSNGRRYMFTWWPTKALASFVARMWAAMLRRLTRAEELIEVREMPNHGI